MSTRAVREVIRRLQAEGRCVLFSSPVMQEVSALCDRIIVIAKGRAAAEGAPEELLAPTASPPLKMRSSHWPGRRRPRNETLPRPGRVPKELTGALRDRRSVYSILVGALVGPLLNRIAGLGPPGLLSALRLLQPEGVISG